MPMHLPHPKTLLTGKPGIGKTTLVRKIIEQVRSTPMAGFYTAEIRSKGKRCGFELYGLNGARGVLAHVNIKSRQLEITRNNRDQLVAEILGQR